MYITHVKSLKSPKRRRMYLPSERVRVSSNNLGSIGTGLNSIDLGDGNLGFSFKPFKAIKRAFTFKKSSFTMKNILGTIGSVGVNAATLGIASMIKPKVFSAHSKTMRTVGKGALATAGAVVAAVGTYFTGGALLKFLPVLLPILQNAAGMLGKKQADVENGPFGKFMLGLNEKDRQLIASNITADIVAGIDSGAINPHDYLASLKTNLPLPNGVSSQIYSQGGVSPQVSTRFVSNSFDSANNGYLDTDMLKKYAPAALGVVGVMALISLARKD